MYIYKHIHIYTYTYIYIYARLNYSSFKDLQSRFGLGSEPSRPVYALCCSVL